MTTEPKSFYVKPAVTSLMKNKPLIIAGVIGIAFLAAFIFMQKNQPIPKKSDIKAAAKVDENVLYSKAQIDTFIKDQLSKKDADQKGKIRAIEARSPVARKLKTGMAVFVKKEEDKKSAAPIISKNKNLGIPTGSKIKAHLANAIFSFNVTSPAVAVVDEDFIKDEEVIIPKGTQFIGDAAVQKSRDRINVRFPIMVLPGGKEMKVNTMALSLDGSGGIKGRVDRQDDKSIFKAIGEMALAGSAVVLGANGSGALSLSDELRLNAARNLSDDARNSLNQVKIEESVSVEAYTPILVLFLDAL
jgi:type IV secretory pathway VirB10-like protein